MRVEIWPKVGDLVKDNYTMRTGIVLRVTAPLDHPTAQLMVKTKWADVDHGPSILTDPWYWDDIAGDDPLYTILSKA